jgi:hypothetical protein
MRFSLANLLLLSTALAAPALEVDRAARAARHDSLIARGLVAIDARAFVAPKPIPVKPIPKPVAPVRPGSPADPVAPTNPDPPALRPDENPDGPAVRPDDPNAPKKPEEPDLPGLRPEQPKPKPAPRPDGCSKRKRCVGADPALEIDTKYNRQRFSDPEGLPDGPYRRADDTDFETTLVDNSDELKRKFGTETWPQMENTLKQDGWTPKQIEDLKGKLMRKFGPTGNTEISKTHEKAKANAGEIIVEDSKNAELDLRRTSPVLTEKVSNPSGRGPKVDKTYTRPATAPETEVSQYKMIADNYRMEAEKKGLPANSIRQLHSHNIGTPATKTVLTQVQNGRADVTYSKGSPEFDNIATNTFQGRRPGKVLTQPGYEGMEVKSFRVYLTNGRWDMTSNVGPV